MSNNRELPGLPRRLLLVLGLMLIGSSPALTVGARAEAGAYDSYLGVKSYRLRLTWMGGDGWRKREKSEDGKCYTDQTFSAFMGASVSYKLVLTRVSRSGVYQWRTEKGSRPTGQFQFSTRFDVYKSKCKDTPESWAKNRHSGGGIGEGDGRLTIDAKTGEFRLFGYVMSANGEATEETGPGGTSQTLPGGLALGVGNSEQPGLPGEITGALTPGGKSITGTPVELPWTGIGYLCRRPMRLTWSVERWEDEDAPEVIVEPVDYENWWPKGNLDRPEEPGNDLQVKFRVQAANDPAQMRRAYLDLSIPYVSKNPGVCMNWPAEGAESKEGIRFKAEDFPEDGPWTFVDEFHVTSRDAVETANVRVHAYDYGAWATLRVTATVPGGAQGKVKILGKETPDLTIPQDDDGNRVADSWEEAIGAKGRTAPSDDDDKPAGKPGTNGDGLTMYEEYRGFVVKGTHIRTDPKRKDVFVCDTTEKAGAGIDLFRQATQLEVHKVMADEMGNETKIVNRNSDPATHSIDQHGIRIVFGNKQTTDPITQSADGSGRFGPPVMTSEIELPPAWSFAGADSTGDVAHELAHAVGLAHHGDKEMEAKFWTWEADNDGNWQLYEQDVDTSGDKPKWQPGRKAITVFFEKGLKPLTHGDSLPLHFTWIASRQGWLIWIGGKGSQFSGDQECLMRYPDKQAYKSLTQADTVRYIPDESQWKQRTRLCENATGTGVNESSHQPQSRYGDATLGNCRGQLVVNDKYAGK
ncbi:MAG TPA: hypothetical protein VG734_05765 [Lacunisphaera sp.]|nr:hypothetical protein [Lacunisphaera sp.]